MAAMHDELIRLTAAQAVARLERGDITPLDLIDVPSGASPRWSLPSTRCQPFALSAGASTRGA